MRTSDARRLARELISTVREGRGSRSFDTAEARALIDPALREDFSADAQARDILGMVCTANSQRRMYLAVALAPGCLDLREMSRLLAEAIQSGDTFEHRALVRYLIAGLGAEGFPLFDSDEAERAFASLPDVVTVYRGGLRTEGQGRRPFGIHWSLSREVAERFASNTSFKRRGPEGIEMAPRPPTALFEAKVKRADICGLLLERKEHEALIVGGLSDIIR